MAKLVIFNKPYDTLCQFTPNSAGESTLADYIDLKGFYAAGRLDKDSEGLVLLTDNGRLQARISDPEFKMDKSYWVQLEGKIDRDAIEKLEKGVSIRNGSKSGADSYFTTRPAKIGLLNEVSLPERDPPIRKRKHIPTSWIDLTLKEGKNRQIRRMTAATGFPTLRLYRHRIGPWQVADLKLGEYRVEEVHLPSVSRGDTGR